MANMKGFYAPIIDLMLQCIYTARPGNEENFQSFVSRNNSSLPRVPGVALLISESRALISRLRRLLLTQAVLTVVVAAIYFALKGGESAVAALFGGSIALANSGLLAWRARQTEQGRVLNAHQSMRVLIRSMLERYATVAALFAMGMGVLKLSPLPMVIGFVVCLAALFGLGKSIDG